MKRILNGLVALMLVSTCMAGMDVKAEDITNALINVSIPDKLIEDTMSSGSVIVYDNTKYSYECTDEIDIKSLDNCEGYTTIKVSGEGRIEFIQIGDIGKTAIKVEDTIYNFNGDNYEELTTDYTEFSDRENILTLPVFMQGSNADIQLITFKYNVDAQGNIDVTGQLNILEAYNLMNSGEIKSTSDLYVERVAYDKEIYDAEVYRNGELVDLGENVTRDSINNLLDSGAFSVTDKINIKMNVLHDFEATTVEAFGYKLNVHGNINVPLLSIDNNRDGNVNALDASRVLVYAAMKGSGNDVSNFTGVEYMDANRDNLINASDASVILVISANIGSGMAINYIDDYIKK